MKNTIKKIGVSILGLLQGTVGSGLALLGWAFAFPQTEAGSKDYEEDMLFSPLGFLIMLAWIVVMMTAFFKLRKNKGNLLLFFIPWLIGTIAFLVYLFFYVKECK